RSGLIAAVLLLLIAPACESDFDILNTDPTRLTGIDPEMQLNTAIVNSATNLTMLQCETSIVKQHMRIFTGVGACGNFNVDARNVSNNNWNNGYLNRLRNVVDGMRTLEDDPGRANLYNALRIWRAYTMM